MSAVAFHHIHIKSAAPMASAQFYCQLFDASLTDETVPDGRQVLDLGGLRLYIDRHDEGATPVPAAPLRGLEHMAFDVADLDAMITRLDALGVRLANGPRTLRPGLRIAFFHGPDGEYIELIERR